MMETTASSSSASVPPSFPIGISPADLTLGQEVDVESRTWAGINRPGGHATVIKIHRDDYGVANKVDVKYVLGGREFDVELTYVKAHVDLSRGSRGRRRDVKMNLETLGGAEQGRKKAMAKGGKKNQGGGAKKKKTPSSPAKHNKGGSNKKRKALASLDRNGGNQAKAAKVAKKSSKKAEEEESSKKSVAEAAVEAGAAKQINKVEEEESAKKDVADVAIETTEVGTENGKWTLIQDGTIADYTSILIKGVRISYWWSDEDGWLPGTISKSLAKVVTPSTIRWTVKVDLDNGDKHKLTFHPLEKRWKVFEFNEEKPSSTEVVSEPKKRPASVKKSAPKKPASDKKSSPKKSMKTAVEKKDATTLKATNKITAEKQDKKQKAATGPKNPTTDQSSLAPQDKAENQDKKGKAGATIKNPSIAQSASSNKSNSTQIKRHGQQTKQKPPSTSLSFGSNLQSKIKEISSKMHNSAAAKTSSSKVAEGLVNYSPANILAVQAAHARSFSHPPSQQYSTLSIGYSSSLPRGLSPDETRKELPQDMEEKAAKKAAPSPEPSKVPVASRAPASEAARGAKRGKERAMAVKKSKDSKEYGESQKRASSGKGGSEKSVMQSLYKSECEKADKFVDFMTGFSKIPKSEKSASAAVPLSLSPENDEGDDLELKMDQERMNLFNSILTEIMFRQRLDMMEVEEMMEKLNRRAESSKKPFTLLEIKPYLQKLHEDSRIFMVEEEGTMGVIYAI